MGKKKSAVAPNSKAWSAMALLSGLVAARGASVLLNKFWKSSTKRNPPINPADPDVELWEAVAWSALTGATVAMIKMFAQRRAAHYYVKSTGHLPPQLAEDGR
ncbi:DUF4235 domain-containing protein [Nocardioides sp. Iso805N]|uniref:DUF4235 domain-containing protein n=1 Tax=Nocardioides sp. Iso805N TaxID=1283287 RepID=UPI000378B6D8|nr:DUF4235 domain-containing protein [Nocardioides sp. Iso805N]